MKEYKTLCCFIILVSGLLLYPRADNPAYAADQGKGFQDGGEIAEKRKALAELESAYRHGVNNLKQKIQLQLDSALGEKNEIGTAIYELGKGYATIITDLSTLEAKNEDARRWMDAARISYAEEYTKTFSPADACIEAASQAFNVAKSELLANINKTGLALKKDLD